MPTLPATWGWGEGGEQEVSACAPQGLACTSLSAPSAKGVASLAAPGSGWLKSGGRGVGKPASVWDGCFVKVQVSVLCPVLSRSEGQPPWR